MKREATSANGANGNREAEELKPCPFCGSDEAVLYECADYPKSIGKRWSVICNHCDSQISTIYQEKWKAVNAWNTRAERTCHLSDKHQAHSFDGQARDCLECGYEFDCDCGEDERFYCCPGCGAKVADDD